MTYKAVGANNPFIKNINSIKYVVETNGTTTLVVNQTQLVGRYPTLANAQDAAAGILIKLGSKDPTTRLGQIFTQTVNLGGDGGGGNLLPPTGGDVTLDPVTLLPVRHYRTLAYENGVLVSTDNSYMSIMIRATGITEPVTIRYSAGRPKSTLYYLKTTYPSASSAAYPPSAEPGFVQWYLNYDIVVNPNDYLRLKAEIFSSQDYESRTDTYSLLNQSENGQLWASGTLEYILTTTTNES